MIKRARRQFVLSAMAAMGVVLLALVAVINVMNYVQTERRMGSALAEMTAAVEAVMDAQTLAAETEPEWRVESYMEEVPAEPEAEEPEDSQAESSEEPEDAAMAGADQPPMFFGGRWDHPGKGPKWDAWMAAQQAMAAETAAPTETPEPEERIIHHYYYYYETENDSLPDLRNTALNQYAGRFLIVTIPESGLPVADMSESSALSEEDAVDLAARILEKGRESGYLDDYRYSVRDTEAGTRVYVLDCAAERHANRSLLLISCLVGLGGLLLALVFVMRMSKKAIWPLEESMDRQKRFITDAGHELKTPLAVIGTNMEILSMDIGKNEWVEGTQGQLRRLRKLVANLISLSRLEEDREELELQFFNLSETAMECADSFTGMAELAGKTLETEIQPDLTIQGDVMTLGQLLTILCDNAVKYAQGEAPIQVRLYASGKRVIFETENDWNHSLAPEELDHLFDRFYRGDAARSREGTQTGYGLGLSIAQAIAEKNHAKLSVRENEQGRLVFQVVFRV